MRFFWNQIHLEMLDQKILHCSFGTSVDRFEVVRIFFFFYVSEFWVNAALFYTLMGLLASIFFSFAALILASD